MDSTTIRTKPKPFAWSYSRLKNYETCPKKYYELDVAKNLPQEQSEELIWGGQVHAAIARRLGEGKQPLPAGYEQFEEWATRIESTPGKIIVEQKLAIKADFGPCTYFDKDVWFRSVADVLKINGPVGLLGDWKTGKIVEDSVQLALSAAVIFAHYPELEVIRSEFFWLKEDARTSAIFRRNEMADMWRGLWSRIEQLKAAHENTDFPPKPGRLCKRWCPVQKCPHWGE